MTIERASNGTELAYDTFGSPSDPAILLIQGLSAQMIGWADGFCALLADAGYFVVRFDNRDVGRSQRFPAGGYLLRDMAEDAVGLLDALDIRSVHVVGASMGGMIGQELAAAHPDRVRSLSLLFSCANTSWVLPAATDRPFAAPPKNKADAVDLFVAAERSCASAAYPQDIEALRDLGARMYDRDPAKDGVPRQAEAMFASPARDALLRTLTLPTLIIAGDADLMIDHHASEQMHELITNSRLVILPGVGHELPVPLWIEISSAITEHALHADQSLTARVAQR